MNKIKIKKKMELKATLRDEGYDRIAIWPGGTWVDVGSGYGGEQDGKNPAAYITRSQNYDLTFKEIFALIAEKETEINRCIV